MKGIILNHVLSQVTPVYNDKYIYGIENRTKDHAPGKKKKKILDIASAINDASNEEIKSGKTLRNPKGESIYIYIYIEREREREREREIDRYIDT